MQIYVSCENTYFGRHYVVELRQNQIVVKCMILTEIWIQRHECFYINLVDFAPLNIDNGQKVILGGDLLTFGAQKSESV